MAYTSIASSEIEVGQPVDQELLQKVKDNFDFFNAEFLNRDSMNAVVNGSFENASSNTPENWTVTLYTGGAATYQDATTDVMHGKGALSFTHPGGAGNGGGYVQSDYFPVSTYINGHIVISHLVKCSATSFGYSMPVYFYDKDKNYTTLVVMSSLATWTANKVYRRVSLVSPPTDSKFARVLLICGGTALTSSGTMTVDNVMIDNMGVVRDVVTYDDSTALSNGSQASTDWNTHSTFYVDLPRSNTDYIAEVTFEHGAYCLTTVSTTPIQQLSTAQARFRKGTTYMPHGSTYTMSTSTAIGQSNHIEVTFRTTGGRVPINFETQNLGATGVTVYSKKTSPITHCHMLPMST